MAGSARVDVSPHGSTFLWGYPHVERMSTGVHDSLYASALLLGWGSNRTITVAVDVLYVSGAIVDECRRRIAQCLAVPPEHIMISATHTHSGPVTCEVLAMSGDPVVPEPDPAYVELLIRGVVQAACRAAERLEPAELAVTAARVDGVGCNRLHPDAARDPEAGLVVVRRERDGAVVALQVVYAMHPTVLHEDSTLVSSDFPHFARCRIEEEYPEAITLYHNGPCGNLSPRYHVKDQTFAEAERLGRRLGRFVVDAVAELSDTDFRRDAAVTGAQAFVQLVPRRFPSVHEAEERLREARERYARLKHDNAAHGPLRTAECTVFGAEEVVTMAQAQADGSLRPVQDAHIRAEVQVFRVGDAFVVGLPGECFVEYGLAIKKRAGVPVFVVSMANGHLQGYITTPEATGYEANLSMFLPVSGQIFADTALQLILQQEERQP